MWEEEEAVDVEGRCKFKFGGVLLQRCCSIRMLASSHSHAGKVVRDHLKGNAGFLESCL